MVQGRMENERLIITLEGEINSFNALQVEKEIHEIREAYPCSSIELDCERLKHASSAGLRIILRLIQQTDNTIITNVHPDMYEILDITGFTEITEVRKAYREFSVDGCEVIGQGANGKVYRIDPDTIVKVYLNPNALPEIHRERELARLAFVVGVPTAIPYDVVRISGGGYGSVFELLNAKSFAKLLIDGDRPLDDVAKMSVDLLKLIHSKVVRSDSLPDMKAVALDWAGFLKDHLPAEQYEKLHALIAAVPQDDHLMHGDYHIKNIEYQNGEYLLIDMDTLCHGHPIFEMSSMYNAYVGFGLVDPEELEKFMGLPVETCHIFWRKSLEYYLGTKDAAAIDAVEAKAGVVGLMRLMRREIRRGGLDREDGRRMIEAYRAGLVQLMSQVDSLTF
ncbi:MAG: phosphotransferase [Clostridia bacterium]|nr:phosphotransferase [Clostridia bacterium]